ncbi:MULTISPECIES: DUF819 family protein [Shewanella]|uniref:DUF819 family protein n=1 Tax=Shewanella septentrionalis TaxID=2952223 RepID=A0A9X2WW45_9GAMM|nr:DUF819 family protein [Shewanella sp.]MCT7946551.1 DUF819 family protein [Shewanella septentrionalis]
MISSDLEIGLFLGFLLCGLFYTHTSSINFFKHFYRIFPLMLMCYALPAIFSSLHFIDASNSQLSEMAKTHLMPGCLFLLILGTDFFALSLVGKKLLGMYVLGAVSICIGGPLSLWLGSIFFPYELVWQGDNAAWKGMSTLMANWLGGTANQLAIKEIHDVGDAVFAVMMAINILFSSLWMVILLFIAERQDKIDEYLKANKAYKPIFPNDIKSKPLDKQTTYYWIMILSCTFLTVIFFSENLSSFLANSIANSFPYLFKYNLTSDFFWSVLIVTFLGLSFSLTNARHVLVKETRHIALFIIYIMIMLMGLNFDISALSVAPYYVCIGLIWFAIHIVILFTFTVLLRLPIMYLAIASQCNIGGAASAPVIASAFHPRLASAALLMAVWGYTWASLLAWYFGFLMQFIQP